MRTNIEAVFLDIDGTLYYDGRLVPSAAKTVKTLLKKENLVTTICTGRSVIHTQKVKTELGIENGVYFNGGLVHYQNKQIYATPLHNETVTNVTKTLSEHNIPTIFHTEHDLVSFAPIPENLLPVLKKFDFPAIEVVTEDTWSQITHPVFQLNAFMNHTLESLIKQEFTECLIYRWDNLAVDLQRRDSDKSIGALALLDYLGISPEHAVHFGDGGNDIGMFDSLGYSVAMGNANDEVKKHAKIVTRPANEDGVHFALKQLGLID
jgi:Cof subfamily protein (haloacid dehalogenase superfamily)